MVGAYVAVALNTWVWMECMHYVVALLTFVFYRDLLVDFRVVESLALFMELWTLAWFCGHLWVITTGGTAVALLCALRLGWYQISGTHFAWKAFLCRHHELQRRARATERRVT